MKTRLQGIVETGIESWEQSMDLVGRLFAVAEPGTVYSEPVTAGDYTLITASEVRVGMGVGYGFGAGGEGSQDDNGSEGEEKGEVEADENAEGPAGFGAGGGGGGGGFSLGRPIAVISVGPGGVQVRPIVDVAGVAVAFFTMFGSLMAMLSKMRQAAES